LASKLRRADIDAAAGVVEETARIVTQIRTRWPQVRIVLRADSGFAREALMGWCEANGVDFLFGLAKNQRLVAEITAELAAAEEDSKASGQPARRFTEFSWSTRDSWSRQRRVIAKAEWTAGQANPRFVVTSLSSEDAEPQRLYEETYCARGGMENRIKECQLDLHQQFRHEVLFLEQLAHEPQGRSSVASALHHVENLALVIDSTPQIQPLAGDAHHHLVQVPAIAQPRAALAQPSRDRRPELQHRDRGS
jgi:hypothetical protein